jgi:uncharacterized protein (TIGR03083 family)
VTDPITSLRSSHERLRSVVEPLTPEQVRERAYPSEWSIAQVLSHLGSGAEIGAMIVQAGKSGAEPPSRDSYPGIWDRWNAKDPDAMVADGLDADAHLVDLVESLRDPRFVDTTFMTFLGPMDRTGYTTLRLSEHAVHTWDVVVAVEPGALVAPDAVEVILPNAARLAGLVAKANGRTARIRITTEDQEYALTLAEQSTMALWDGGDPTASLRIPNEALVRLIYGRLDAANTPAGVEADGVTLDDLRAVFPGF